MPEVDDKQFTNPGQFVDSDTPAVAAFAAETAGHGSDIERAVSLYGAIRDGIVYDPYLDFTDAATYRASSTLQAGRGFCVGKAALLAAGARAVGIPARLGYADVRNHMTSRRLYELLKSDVFRWHSYAELYLDGAWVKATPAFNATLCEKVGVAPLEFDGRSDSLFQPLDKAGRRYMEYLVDRGTYADVPFETIQDDFRIHYPMLFETVLSGDFASEAVASHS